MLKALTEQINYSGTSIREYGYDQSNTVNYQFNSSGFRDIRDFNYDPDIAFLGGSISFGVGVSFEYCYSQVIANKLDLKSWNLSYAQEYYDNEIIFETVTQLYRHVQNIPLVIQWVSDKRNLKFKKDCYQLIKETNTLFDKCIHLMIDSKESKLDLIKDEFDLINPPWMDFVANKTHPGIKTHSALSGYILKRMYDRNIFTKS